MERPKADSFTTFLEAQERAHRGTPVTGPTPLTLLFKLAEAPQAEMRVTELMAASGMSLIDFAEALKNLKDSGYLTLSGPPNNESATLTKVGEDVARLAQTK
jgi:predicted transcriptional regulator